MTGFPGVPVCRIPAANPASVPNYSPLRYPGGKTWMVPHIREWLEAAKPDVLVEPFAGGATASLVAVMENFARTAVVNDLDSDVAAFWEAAIHDPDRLIEFVRGFRPTLHALRSIERNRPRDQFMRGARTLVLNRARSGGILAPGASFSKPGKHGRPPRWYSETIAARLEAIKSHAHRLWFINSDGLRFFLHDGRETDLLNFAARENNDLRRNAAYFIDPPYAETSVRTGIERLYTTPMRGWSLMLEGLGRMECDFLATAEANSEVLSMVRGQNFHVESVEMKTGRHRIRTEFLITREPVFG